MRVSYWVGLTLAIACGGFAASLALWLVQDLNACNVLPRLW